MHLVRYRTADGATEVGVRVRTASSRPAYTDMLAFIAAGEAALEAPASRVARDRPVVPEQILAPIDNPGKMLFLGMTYDVFREGVATSRSPTSTRGSRARSSGPGDAIRLPSEEAHVLYEGELVVVIGEPMFRVPAADAMSHVYGYTQANDVTWTQWVHGSTKVGPADLPVEERRHVLPARPRHRHRRRARPRRPALHGHRERGSAHRGHDPRARVEHRGILEFLSQDVTLWPGDLISTGTCEAKDLVDGDVVAVEFEGLGRLENPVIGRWRPEA